MIVFISNFLNHHQMPVAEKLYELTGGKYRFIEQEPMPESFRQAGYPTYDDLPFLIQYWRSPSLALEAKRLVLEAEAVLYGNISDYSIIRQRLEKGMLTFECGERWFKRGWINLLSPRLIKTQIYYHIFFRNKPLYRLNASAYAANDMARMYSFKNKMFKWGYFTSIPSSHRISQEDNVNSKLKILWVARFLKLKHPELPVKVASNLKAKGYNFELSMYGSGPELERIKALIDSLGLDDCVFLKGNLPNTEILEEMRRHEVFLFTSDRHEGWGAVLNESMSNGCAVIASEKIGSVPFLIEDGKNGLIFKDKSVDDLTSKLQQLFDNPPLCRGLGKRAMRTMREVWSPENAALSLIKLIDGIKNGTPEIIPSGPCSPAYPV